MAELFGIDKSGIRRHLAKIFETDELDEEVVVAKMQQPLNTEQCRIKQRLFLPITTIWMPFFL